MALKSRSTVQGFTLLEMVISLLLFSIVLVAVTAALRLPIDAYIDILRRSLLADAAETASRRLTQEVHLALPNSLRLDAGETGQCIEFLPVTGAGVYRLDARADGSGDLLNFAAQDSSFDVMASRGLPDFAAAVTSGQTYHVVIYNLGIPDADAYNAADRNHAQISNGSSTSSRLSFSSVQFILESPVRRFMVIPDNTVIYSCAGGALRRSTRTLAAAASKLASCPSSGGQLLAENTTCSFYYAPGASAYYGLLALRLNVAAQGESVTLYREINIENTP